MACSHTTTCPLFPLISVNSALKVWKTFYCEGKYENCARFNLSKTGQSVPANLLPNGKTLTTAGMASEGKASPTDKAKAVEKAAPQIVEEMASIELDDSSLELDIPVDISSGAPAAETVPAASVEREVPAGDTRSWYLRIMFNTDSGVVGNVIQTFGSHRIKIDAMAEKRQGGGGQVAMVLIVLTDQTTEDNLNAALAKLKSSPSIVGTIKKIELEYLSGDMFN